MNRLLLLVFAFLFSCAPDNRHTEDLGDTVFISRNRTSHGYYTTVFIEQDKAGTYHKRLGDFSEFDSNHYRAFYSSVKERYPQAYKQNTLGALPRQWLPVKKYKEKYFLYAPNDWGIKNDITISDSALVCASMDRPDPTPLQSFKQLDRNTYELNCLDPYSSSFVYYKIIIHILNTEPKMAIWEFPGETTRYELYAPLSSLEKFDVIVNYASQGKIPEFKGFVTPDYEALLKNKR